MEEVRKTFQEIAERYDRYRRQLIPCFDAFYTALVDRVPFASGQNFKVLDLGAGTGLLSKFLFEKFPQAQFTLVDLAPEMLQQARERFAGSERFQYRVADYSQADLGGPFDLVVSSLSIHHLEDSAKRELYRKIYGSLVPEGAFLNAEFVRAADPEVQRQHWDLWLQKMRAAGLSEAEVGQALQRTGIDILTTVEAQVEWLQEIGFRQVDCVFRDGLFAVFGGRR